MPVRPPRPTSRSTPASKPREPAARPGRRLQRSRVMRLHFSFTRKSSLLGFGLTGALLAAAGIALSAGDPPPTGTASTAAYSISGTTETLQPGVPTHLTLTVSNPQSARLYLNSVSAN